MAVSEYQIERALAELGLAGRPVCLHASLRSFGLVEGGADAVVRAFLAAGCTLLVPAFTWRYAVQPPPEELPARNGWPRFDYPAAVPRRYTTGLAEVDRDMGAVAAAVAAWPGRARGPHPLCSFAAVGPLARELVDGQRPEDGFAPLAALAERAGSVVLAGVGLERLTLLHLAEAMAGREPFRRWGAGPDGRAVRAAVGGCSEGFGKLLPALEPIVARARVGASAWIVLPAAGALARAAAAIRADPGITRCGDPDCARCRDAIAGGPILDQRPGDGG